MLFFFQFHVSEKTVASCRLVDDEDRKSLAATLAQLSEKHFKEKLGRLLGVDKQEDEVALLGGLRALIFGDFMVPGQGQFAHQPT